MEYKLVYDLSNVRNVQALGRILPGRGAQAGAALEVGETRPSAVLFPFVDTRKFPSLGMLSINIPADSDWHKMR